MPDYMFGLGTRSEAADGVRFGERGDHLRAFSPERRRG